MRGRKRASRRQLEAALDTLATVAETELLLGGNDAEHIGKVREILHRVLDGRGPE